MKQILKLRHMEDRKLNQDRQQSFTKGKACLINLVASYDGVTTSVDKGRAIDVIYLDFCEFFDVGLYSNLLSKLKRDGFDWLGG
ncbi:rna-directed dna polymerase from mobile element jockey-like [Willisornis vidua]|uniref:Rna-directed dna polymerase from mobile element jockey-like n=1 Tax=Willisornis vidua TaxID=1566151 RepID=A0ABQ9D066_9PASS|nr:rna-directed dna polymerase from mobile element jockey-like [Willisornis vidua]